MYDCLQMSFLMKIEYAPQKLRRFSLSFGASHIMEGQIFAR